MESAQRVVLDENRSDLPGVIAKKNRMTYTLESPNVWEWLKLLFIRSNVMPPIKKRDVKLLLLHNKPLQNLED